MCLRIFFFFSLSFLRKSVEKKKKKKKKKKKNIEDDRLSLRFVFFEEREKSTRVLGPSRPALRDVVDVDVVVPGSEKLLDFSQPFEVTVLDAVVNAFYSPGGNPQLRAEAEQIMKQMQEHEHSWTRVDGILEHSKSANTKFSLYKY